MTWRERLGDKLVSVERAAGEIASGDRVAIAPYTCTPHTLCRALAERGRRGELENVRIDHPASGVSWTEPEMRGVFELLRIIRKGNRVLCRTNSTSTLVLQYRTGRRYLWNQY